MAEHPVWWKFWYVPLTRYFCERLDRQTATCSLGYYIRLESCPKDCEWRRDEFCEVGKPCAHNAPACLDCMDHVDGTDRLTSKKFKKMLEGARRDYYQPKEW